MGMIEEDNKCVMKVSDVSTRYRSILWDKKIVKFSTHVNIVSSYRVRIPSTNKPHLHSRILCMVGSKVVRACVCVCPEITFPSTTAYPSNKEQDLNSGSCVTLTPFQNGGYYYYFFTVHLFFCIILGG